MNPPVPNKVEPPSELKINVPVKGRAQRFVDWAVGLMTGTGENSIRVYLPALSTDPNSGATLGFMPVWLLQDERKVIRHIIAPSVTHNGIFGVTPTIRYYHYPHPDAQLFFIGSKSQTTNERLTLRYIDPHFHGFLFVGGELSHQIEGSNRFFGFGPNTPHSAESTYSLDESKTSLTLGVNLPLHSEILWTMTYRDVEIRKGPLGDLPQAQTAFPGASPDGHVPVVTERLSLIRDSRDSTVTPTEGTYFELYGDLSRKALGSTSEFTRYGVEGKAFLPNEDASRVSALRFLYGLETGAAPFFEQFWLGGSSELRGYGDGRFVDRAMSLFNFEERIRVYRMRAFGVDTDFEFTPLFDVGSVFPDFRQFQLNDYHFVGGFGMRAVVKPTVVGLVDVGYGDEGLATFVSIDYPF
jgi:hypothetical protein